jgi:DNA-binding transcriptional ArsR family regulator
VNAQRFDDPAIEDVDDARFEAATATFKLLADGTRLRIVWALLHGEHAVSELADHVGVAVPAVSQHLAKLRLAGLVTTRRDGTRIHYSAADEHVLRIVTEALVHAERLSGSGAGPTGTRRAS